MMNKIDFVRGVFILVLFGFLFYLASKVKVTDSIELYSDEYLESERILAEYHANIILFPADYETIVVDSVSRNELIKYRTKSTREEAFDYILKNSKKINKGFCYIYDDDLYDVVLEFNNHPKIPLHLYMSLFPEEDILNYFDFVIRKDSVDVQHRVTRKFEKCYGYNDLVNHMQLIVIGKGELFPTVYLLTYSKESLDLVSERIIYKIENKDNIVSRLKSCLNSEFKILTEFLITEVDNERSIVDTVKNTYHVTDVGEVILK